MDKLQKDISKAAKARALGEDEAFNGAVAQVREALMQNWVNCKDPEGRDRIWITVNLLEKLADALVATVNDGKLAQAQIDALAAREKAA